jgi:hypothetical protein
VALEQVVEVAVGLSPFELGLGLEATLMPLSIRGDQMVSIRALDNGSMKVLSIINI